MNTLTDTTCNALDAVSVADACVEDLDDQSTTPEPVQDEGPGLRGVTVCVFDPSNPAHFLDRDEIPSRSEPIHITSDAVDDFRRRTELRRSMNPAPTLGMAIYYIRDGKIIADRIVALRTVETWDQLTEMDRLKVLAGVQVKADAWINDLPWDTAPEIYCEKGGVLTESYFTDRDDLVEYLMD